MKQYRSGHEVFNELDNKLGKRRENEYATASEYLARKPGQGLRFDRESWRRDVRGCFQGLYHLVYLL